MWITDPWDIRPFSTLSTWCGIVEKPLGDRRWRNVDGFSDRSEAV
jgi:hypothetical protein